MNDPELRKQLISLLRGEHAHMSIADAVKDFPEKDYNTKAPNVSYSFWGLLEHLRKTQADILEFIVNPKYVYLKWPDDYWPDESKKATKKDWQKTIADFTNDLKKLEELSQDESIKLFAKIPHGEGQTYYREFIVVGNHNSYHIGEFAILRQVVNNWKK